jgi:hypothetical protein
MLYSLVVKDVQKGLATILGVFTELWNAELALENFVVNYVIDKEGVINDLDGRIIDVSTDTISGRVDNLIVDRHYVKAKSVDNMTICKYEKCKVEVPGMIWGTKTTYENRMNRIVHIEIVKTDLKLFSEFGSFKKFEDKLPENVYRTRYEFYHDVSDLAIQDARFIAEEFMKLECAKYLRKNVKDAISVTALRNHFTDEFIHCSHANQKSEPLKGTVDQHADLCASILKKHGNLKPVTDENITKK